MRGVCIGAEPVEHDPEAEGKKTSGLQGGWAYFALKLCGYPSKLSLELAGVVRYKLRSDMGSGLGGRKAGTPYQALYHQ